QRCSYPSQNHQNASGEGHVLLLVHALLRRYFLSQKSNPSVTKGILRGLLVHGPRHPSTPTMLNATGRNRRNRSLFDETERSGSDLTRDCLGKTECPWLLKETMLCSLTTGQRPPALRRFRASEAMDRDS